MRSSENEFKIIFQYKHHHWIFRNVLHEFWQVVNCELRFIIARKVIFVANLHSLPWNITSMAHKIRTTLKRRWVFKRTSGNRCLHDAGEPRPPRKAAAAAAAAAAILCQYIRGQSPTTEKKSVFLMTEFGLWFLDDISEEDIIRDSHLQECLLRHHDGRHSEEARAKLIGKRIHVWGLVALPLPQTLQFWKLGDIRAIRRL